MGEVRWRGASPELFIGLDRAAGEPLGHQLQRQLRESIRGGRLTVGERLPSSRSLAKTLDVSRRLVVEAFEQLTGEGYLEARPGSGTVVSGLVTPDEPPPAAPPTPAAAVDIDFECGIPDLAAFPMQDWQWSIREAARTLPFALMGDEAGAGNAHLRTVVAAYHRRVRAGSTRPEDMLVVGGFRQGLYIVFITLAKLGHRTVALEDPGPREHDQMARLAGLEPVFIPVDEHGLKVAALRSSHATAVVLTPAHQFPTGNALSPDRRGELLHWASDVNGYLIEDDYDAEFRYDRDAVGSMQGLGPGRVIAIGSVSKTLAPGMRIGWVISPSELTASILTNKRLVSRGVPALDQAALALLIESGRYDRFVRSMRKVYAGRRATLVETMGDRLPELPLEGLSAGCHAVLRLPPSCPEDAVVAGALQRSVRVYGMSRYRQLPGEYAPALVLGFGNLTDAKIRRGVTCLADAIKAARRHTGAV